MPNDFFFLLQEIYQCCLNDVAEQFSGCRKIVNVSRDYNIRMRPLFVRPLVFLSIVHFVLSVLLRSTASDNPLGICTLSLIIWWISSTYIKLELRTLLVWECTLHSFIITKSKARINTTIFYCNGFFSYIHCNIDFKSAWKRL